MGRTTLLRLAWCAVLLAAFAGMVLLNQPGHLSVDSVLGLEEGRFGIRKTWNPAIFGWLLGVMDRIYPGPFLVTVLIFLLIKLIPGDPATAILGERASDAAIQALRQQWGLDRPLPVQYAVYMRNLLTGDLGQSLRYRTPVIDLLPHALDLLSGKTEHRSQ